MAHVVVGGVSWPRQTWISGRVGRQIEPPSCWMDKDRPNRSQGGIKVALLAKRRARAGLLALVLMVAPVAEGVAQDADAPATNEPTVMESMPSEVVATQPLAVDELQAADAELPLWAEEAGDGNEISMFPLIAKVSIGLGLVVALAWGSVWLLRRTTLGQGAVGGSSTVRVMERTWLGPKKAIFLVDIAGRTLALGVTDDQISVLSAWEEGQIDITQPQTTPGVFAVQLKSLLKRGAVVGQEVGA